MDNSILNKNNEIFLSNFSDTNKGIIFDSTKGNSIYAEDSSNIDSGDSLLNFYFLNMNSYPITLKYEKRSNKNYSESTLILGDTNVDNYGKIQLQGMSNDDINKPVVIIYPHYDTEFQSKTKLEGSNYYLCGEQINIPDEKSDSAEDGYLIHTSQLTSYKIIDNIRTDITWGNTATRTDTFFSEKCATYTPLKRITSSPSDKIEKTGEFKNDFTPVWNYTKQTGNINQPVYVDENGCILPCSIQNFSVNNRVMYKNFGTATEIKEDTPFTYDIDEIEGYGIHSFLFTKLHTNYNYTSNHGGSILTIPFGFPNTQDQEQNVISAKNYKQTQAQIALHGHEQNTKLYIRNRAGSQEQWDQWKQILTDDDLVIGKTFPLYKKDIKGEIVKESNKEQTLLTLDSTTFYGLNSFTNTNSSNNTNITEYGSFISIPFTIWDSKNTKIINTTSQIKISNKGMFYRDQYLYGSISKWNNWKQIVTSQAKRIESDYSLSYGLDGYQQQGTNQYGSVITMPFITTNQTDKSSVTQVAQIGIFNEVANISNYKIYYRINESNKVGTWESLAKASHTHSNYLELSTTQFDHSKSSYTDADNGVTRFKSSTEQKAGTMITLPYDYFVKDNYKDISSGRSQIQIYSEKVFNAGDTGEIPQQINMRYRMHYNNDGDTWGKWHNILTDTNLISILTNNQSLLLQLKNMLLTE